MKKILDFIQWRHLKHIYHTEKKKIPHYKKLSEEFVRSKNGRLIIMLIIAAMIPLTVIGAQRVQNLQQEAAPSVTQLCDASKVQNVTNATDYKSSTTTAPFKDGETIIFSHTDGKITQDMFDNADFTGNGATGCTFDAGNGQIKCTARYNSKSGKPYSSHTYKFQGSQVFECNYFIAKPVSNPKKPKDPNATRDPSKPTATPKPSKAQPTRGPNAGFDVDAKADGCNAEKVPVLKIKWDLSGKSKNCKITISGGGEKEEITDKNGKSACGDESFTLDVLPRDSDNGLKVKTEYTVEISGTDDSGKSETKKASATTVDKCDTPSAGRDIPQSPP